MEKKHVMEVIKKHWDKRSSAFDINWEIEEVNKWKNVLEKLLGKDKNKSVLDIGTGTGFLANMTGSLGYPTVGLDISIEMLKYAVQRGEEEASSAIYMMGDALQLPFADSSIDYIINSRFIWTLIEPEKALKEWNRIIRQGGGIFCFNTMKRNVGITVKQRKSEFYHDKEADNSLKISGASMNELKDLMKYAGFTDVEIRELPELGEVNKDDIEGRICDQEPWFVMIGMKQ